MATNLPNDTAQKARKVVTAVEQKINKFRPLGVKILDDVRVFVQMLKAACRGEDIPYATISAIVVALVYLVMPFDLVPDFLPGIGLVDDATLIGATAYALRSDMAKFRKRRNAKK